MSASAAADSFFVYVLRCSDGSLFDGHTANLNELVISHNEGRGAQWTASRRPAELTYSETAFGEHEAVRREQQIKRWTPGKKFALANGDRAKRKSLAKRRVR